MRIFGFTGGAFAENTYLAICGDTGEAVAIDPGAAAPRLVETLREEGGRLAAILLTHAHLDHVEGIPAVLAEASVPIYLHPADRPLYDGVPQQAAAFGLRVPVLPSPDHRLEHGDTFAFGSCSLAVSHAPGHAPGHVVFASESDGVAFVGDVIFQGSIGRTDLPGGDYRRLMTSIRERVLTLPDDTRLLTGHGPETTVGHERVGNPFLVPHYGGELA